MVIELRFGEKAGLLNAEHSIKKYFDEPGCFIGFRYLVVKILPTPKCWDSDELTRIGEVVKERLEPRLGPAVLCKGDGEGDDGECIVLHPWSLAGQQNYSLEPVWYLKRPIWEEDTVEDSDDE